MKFFSCFALLMCSAVVAEDAKIPASEFTSDGHTTDTLTVVKQRVKDKKSILLDVREKGEWDSGHLKRAHLVPLSVVKTGKFSKEVEKLLVKDRPIYVHCGSGGRVLTVSKILRARGYDIRPLKDGYSKLLTAGFETAPAEKSADKE